MTKHSSEPSHCERLSVRELLSSILESRHDIDAAVRMIQERRGEIINAFNSGSEELGEDQLQSLQESPELIAALYDALSEPPSDEERAELERLVEIKAADESEIGVALKQLLGATSSEASLEWIQSVRPVSEEVYANLVRFHDVQAVLPAGEWLVRAGIRPLQVFYATEAVHSAAEGASGKLAGGFVQVELAPRAKPAAGPVIPYQRIIDEIISMTELDERLVTRLWNWLTVVCRTTHPYLFGGFRRTAIPRDSTLLDLEVLPKRLSLREQWPAAKMRPPQALSAAAKPPAAHSAEGRGQSGNPW